MRVVSLASLTDETLPRLKMDAEMATLARRVVETKDRLLRDLVRSTYPNVPRYAWFKLPAIGTLGLVVPVDGSVTVDLGLRCGNDLPIDGPAEVYELTPEAVALVLGDQR